MPPTTLHRLTPSVEPPLGPTAGNPPPPASSSPPEDVRSAIATVTARTSLLEMPLPPKLREATSIISGAQTTRTAAQSSPSSPRNRQPAATDSPWPTAPSRCLLLPLCRPSLPSPSSLPALPSPPPRRHPFLPSSFRPPSAHSATSMGVPQGPTVGHPFKPPTEHLLPTMAAVDSLLPACRRPSTDLRSSILSSFPLPSAIEPSHRPLPIVPSQSRLCLLATCHRSHHPPRCPQAEPWPPPSPLSIFPQPDGGRSEEEDEYTRHNPMAMIPSGEIWSF